MPDGSKSSQNGLGGAMTWCGIGWVGWTAIAAVAGLVVAVALSLFGLTDPTGPADWDDD